MTNVFTKTLPKRIRTKQNGVYYKEIQQTTIDDKGRSKIKIIDKVYIVRYRDRNKEHFVTVGKYSEGIRLAYCIEKRNEFLTFAKNGELPPMMVDRQKKEVITLNNLADVYFDEKKMDDNENKRQRSKYEQHIKPTFGKVGISRIEQRDVLKFRDKLQSINMATAKDLSENKKAIRHYAPQTVNGIIKLLSTIFNYSIKYHQLKTTNPCFGIKKLSVDDVRERYLEQEEIRELKEVVKDDHDVYIFVHLSLITGGRGEAIVKFKKKDVNLRQGTITVYDAKRKMNYTGFLDVKTKSLLREIMPTLNSNDYLVGQSAEKFPFRTIQNRLKKVLDRLFNQGLDRKDAKNRVVVHTLRHTFASQLAIAGVPIYTIQKLMNHADIEHTMRYAKLAPDSGKEYVQNLYTD